MFKNDHNQTNIIAYRGPISINLVSFLGKYIQEAISAKTKISSKIYKVFIEIIQNVSYYSAESNNNTKGVRSGIGWFTIDEFPSKYELTTGNLIAKEHGPILKKNCDEINSMNEEELRDLKRKTRSKASIKDIGAHIGLIQTGLITQNPLTIDISEVDDKYDFFTLKVEIDK